MKIILAEVFEIQISLKIRLSKKAIKFEKKISTLTVTKHLNLTFPKHLDMTFANHLDLKFTNHLNLTFT